eukprot:TRINITY_DN25600_c0_g1_i4.p2 TRINITY_DN25600_c0_g1~~TRINITY_DN25600_c0_g1_i4.p2  ORF type:complete len:132 (-),score=32.94 TRINITY_DN25600_c0_g1_i4:144-539(-)
MCIRDRVSTQSTWAQKRGSFDIFSKTQVFTENRHLKPRKRGEEYKATQERVKQLLLNCANAKHKTEVDLSNFAPIKSQINSELDGIQKMVFKKKKEYEKEEVQKNVRFHTCLLYTSPSPRDLSTSRMPSSA